MRGKKRQTLWQLARDQHWVVTRRQLLSAAMSSKAIEHRLATGRLHRLYLGVYAVGPADPTRQGRWMAAVLACGEGAALSHGSAAALYGIEDRELGFSVSVPSPRNPARPELRVHRVSGLGLEVGTYDRIPVTTPARTLLDLATEVSGRRLEAAVNAADRLGLIDPEELRAELARRRGQPGVRILRELLDRDTFALTESELERRFLRIALTAGLGVPQTGARVNGFVVDFFWPDLGLVVETDGLRYHRTPIQQARDRRRDQAHLTAGLTPLRFTHRQVFHEPDLVKRTLAAIGRQLRGEEQSG